MEGALSQEQRVYNFTDSALVWVRRLAVWVFLSCLIISWFQAMHSAGEKTGRAYSMTVYLTCWFLLPGIFAGFALAGVNQDNKLTPLKIVSFLVLIMVGMVLLNLFLTALAYLATFFMELAGGSGLGPTDVLAALDMTYKRTPKVCLFGDQKGCFVGDIFTVAGAVRAAATYAPDERWQGLKTMVEVVSAVLTNDSCKPDFVPTGDALKLVKMPVEYIDYTDSVLGKLLFLAQGSVYSLQPASRTEAGATCVALAVLRNLLFWSGVWAADNYYAAGLRFAAEFAAPTVPAGALEAEGLVCDRTHVLDLAALYDGGGTEGGLAMTLVLNILHDNPGDAREYSERFCGGDPQGCVVTVARALELETVKTSFLLRKADFTRDYNEKLLTFEGIRSRALPLRGIGFDTRFVEREFEKGRRGAVPRALLLTMLGKATELEGGEAVPDNPEVQSRIVYAMQHLEPADCSAGQAGDACCDKERRPFVSRLGYIFDKNGVTIMN